MKSILALMCLLAVLAQGQSPPDTIAGRRIVTREISSQRLEPFQVIDNIYYVGASNISSHIIVTSEGLILLDTGSEEMLPGIRANIEKLGHELKDVKVILSSHAHWDHIEGHAAMKELTGAKVMALGEDAAALASGTDSSPSQSLVGWNPTQVDRILKDGDIVQLGNVRMQAHLTKGHTNGCTTWTTTVREGGKSYRVVFVGGTSISVNAKLLGNTRHPTIVEDYARTFRVLRELKGEVFLAQHPRLYGMAEKLERLKAGASPNPFIDPEGYQRFVTEQENNYLKRLEEERSTRR